TGDRRPQARRVEPGDVTNAALAGRELRPVLVLAGTQRGDDAHARHHDDGASSLVARRHRPLPSPHTRSTRAMPSPRQCPTQVTATCDTGSLAVPVSPVPAAGNSSPRRRISVAIARLAVNCASKPCPMWVPVARTGSPRVARNVFSSVEAGSAPDAPDSTAAAPGPI